MVGGGLTESGGTVELGFFKRATVYRVKLQTNDAREHAEWLCDWGTNGAARV